MSVQRKFELSFNQWQDSRPAENWKQWCHWLKNVDGRNFVIFGTSELHSLCFFLISQVKQLNIKTLLFSQQCLLWPVAKAEIKDLNVACVASVSRLIPPHKGVKFFWRRILIFTCNYGHLWQPTFLKILWDLLKLQVHENKIAPWKSILIQCALTGKNPSCWISC
jgi:hypothetical protein